MGEQGRVCCIVTNVSLGAQWRVHRAVFGGKVAVPKNMTPQPLNFEVWKARLHEDCQRNNKLLAYNSLGEDCLKILWESGTEPSVSGVVNGGRKA